MRSRVLVLGILIVAALLVLTGCEALDELGEGVATPGVETPGIETPGVETPGVGTPEVEVTPPEAVTPGAEVTPTEAITPGAEITPTEEVTPGVEVTPTEEVTPGLEVTPTETVTPGAELTPTEEAAPGLVVTPTETVTPGAEMTPTETMTPGAEITPTETITPGAEVTPTETMTPGAAVPEGAPEELALADLDDLEQFDSYRTSTVITWTPDTGEMTLIEALVEATIETGLAGVGREATQHTVITLTQGEQQTQTLEFVSRGDETWNRTNGQWVQVSVAPTDLLDQVGWVGNPSVVLSEDARGEFVETETMDGMELWHYRYPSEQIAEEQRFADFEDAQLDAWVSAEHNVVWRMELTATGTGPQGGAGELELVSMVDAVDEPVDFEVPPELEEEGATPEPATTPTEETLPETGAEAPGVLTRNEIPLMEGAMDVRAIGNVVVLNVDRSPAEVIDYYTEQLEGSDWSLEEPESETTARLTRDGRVVNIAAAPGQQEGQSTVFIAVDEE